MAGYGQEPFPQSLYTRAAQNLFTGDLPSCAVGFHSNSNLAHLIALISSSGRSLDLYVDRGRPVGCSVGEGQNFELVPGSDR
uniref:Uncharacterized protein n=1 Tax=Anguilla anguilla TaxID=7936 RepID=A0A0E9T2U5_ANGAN